MAEWAGEHDYRAYVGPTKEYDLLGASQFSLMCTLGLREHHRLLDVGCGSLRGGRLFIPYLERGRYTGVEPNRWLVDEGIANHLGADAVTLKAPTFVYNDRFDLSGLEPFDYILAQSVASHTGPTMTRELLGAIKDALATSGIAAVTFVHRQTDSTVEGWHYPKTAHYRRETIESWLSQTGLKGLPLAWFHPRQTWWAIVHPDTPLPPRLLRIQATGAVLAYRESWDLSRERPRWRWVAS